jgi:hypothetical protein
MSEGQEMSASFVGRIHRYHGEQDGPSYQATSVIDVFDSGKEVEIAWDEGNKRTYLRFRLADFKQALKD